MNQGYERANFFPHLRISGGKSELLMFPQVSTTISAPNKNMDYRKDR